MNTPLTRALLAAVALSLAAVNPAFAEKPSWAGESKGGHNDSDHDGRGKSKKHEHKSGSKHHDSRHEGSINISIGAYFGSPQRQMVHDYYGSQFQSGHCPPGLAKKNNGCLPPGQAKKWAMGKPLPVDLRYYAVPAALVTRLGPPPAGYKYVRVASDILLIAIGTSMVVDAIEDLGGLM